MNNIILLNKDSTYDVVDETTLRKRDTRDIKFILFDNATSTKANVFAMIKAKKLDTRLDYGFIITMQSWNGVDDTIAEFTTRIDSNSICNKYSAVPVMYQYWSVFEVLDDDLFADTYYPGLEVCILDKDSGSIIKSASYTNTDDDDEDPIDVMKHYGVTSTVFNSLVSYGSDVILLFANKEWDIVPLDMLERSSYLHDAIYIGIGSADTYLVTLLNIYEYKLLSTIVEMHGYVLEPGGYTITSKVAYDIVTVVSLLSCIPQAVRFFDMCDNYHITGYELDIYIGEDKYSQTSSDPDIELIIPMELIRESKCQLLPVVIKEIEKYFKGE